MSRSVADVLRARRADLTPAELRVAQTVLADYPSAGLQTVGALAAAAGVSPPTVVRLVAKLGWNGYADLQARLRAELSTRSAGPADLLPAGPRDPSSVLGRIEAGVGAALAQTLRGTDPVEFSKAVGLLADRDRPVLLAGGRVSQPLADYLGRFLTLLRPGVRVVRPDPSARALGLLDTGRGATVVVFDYRRYDSGIVGFGREAARRGAKVVLCTDPYLSPLSAAATVLLTSVVEGPPPFVTLVPAMALAEALVLGVVDAGGPALRRRLASFDRLVGEATS